MNYLFTYKNKENEELNIPNTTNGCDVKFGIMKTKLKNHSGLKVDRKSKMFNKLMWNQALFFLIKPEKRTYKKLFDEINNKYKVNYLCADVLKAYTNYIVFNKSVKYIYIYFQL